MFPSFSVFIGECSLDILALKSSTVFPSVEAGVVTELPDIDFMREIADLFLRAAKLICMSADPQLLSDPSPRNTCRSRRNSTIRLPSRPNQIDRASRRQRSGRYDCWPGRGDAAL